MDINVLRGRIAEVGVTQHDLAVRLGINPTLLNHILKGRRDAPPDFEQRVNKVLVKDGGGGEGRPESQRESPVGRYGKMTICRTESCLSVHESLRNIRVLQPLRSGGCDGRHATEALLTDEPLPPRFLTIQPIRHPQCLACPTTCAPER